MKNLFITLFLFVSFQAFADAQTLAENAPRTVTNFYLQLPMIYVNDSETAAERRKRIEIEDTLNGYLRLKPGAEQDAREYTEIALFKKSGGGYVVAVNSLDCAENCLSTVHFLERRADRWTDVGNRVYRIAPETGLAQYRLKKTAAHRNYDDANGFWTRTDLPREGRTVRVQYTGDGAAKEFELFSLTWNGERFAPDQPLKEIAPAISDKVSAAAEATWKPFFERVKTAVKKRDRKTLRTLMIADFSYNCCDQGYPDNRTGAFTTWDGDPKDYNGWKNLERVLRTETMVESVSDDDLPTRFFDDATFEFGANGRWIFTAFGASRGL